MRKRVLWLVLATALIVALGAVPAFAQLSGAIFTTNSTGTWVNGNTKYMSKEDVYLDGGPGPNAPVTAAGLPAGDYYFQVTDPPGKTLLSVDPITSRKVRVNSYGVIDFIYPALGTTKYQGKTYGTHLAGTEADHGGPPWNAITVQLMPYADTPNNGGVYKVWMTPVGSYSPGNGKFGFIPSESKTDNYKVKHVSYTPPCIKVRKWHDQNANGIWDAGESELFDWTASYVDPLGTSFDPKVMPFSVCNALPDGTWIFTEQMKNDDWFQTAAYVDGAKLAYRDLTAAVTVAGLDKEYHEVWFGNAEKGCLKAFKYRDKNLDSEYNDGDVPLKDWHFVLDGTDLWGNAVHREADTGADGYAVFCKLLPGTYTIKEVMPSDWWWATTPDSWTVTLGPGGCLSHAFGNAKKGCVCAEKFYDKNANGVKDEGEVPVAGIWFKLEGVTYLGNPVGPLYAKSNADGRVEWCKLYPGDYTITEIVPPEHWIVTTDNPQCVKLGEGAKVGGSFGNLCWKCADFNTKGFWHNKNGLAILAEHPEWIAYVNTLPPYADNPFDGMDEYGDPVPAAKGDAMEEIAPAGTALAEISNFLVENNSEYQQLEQQLLAFIFNAKNTGAGAVCGPGGWMSVQSIIDSAIAAWESPATEDDVYWAGVLDCFNNNDCVKVACSEPCVVPDYPYCPSP